MKGSNKPQLGFTMVEVLVSLVVLGVGLLGLTGLQIAAMKGTNNAHSRNIATMLAMELGDRMRANPEGVAGGFYGQDVTCATNVPICRNNRFCTPLETAQFDIQEVMCGFYKSDDKRQGGVVNLLPNGSLELFCENSCSDDKEPHNITLGWNVTGLHKGQVNPKDNLSITIPVIP